MIDTAATITSGRYAVDGFMYQLDVSVWMALDLLLATQRARQLVLEPATEEDLEVDIPDEAGALAGQVELDGYRLVVQCKVRTTGPWKHEDLARLLAHGSRRKPARDRLTDDPRVRYLLVTNADTFGVARQLMMGALLDWPAAMPAELGAQLPADASGRIAVLATLDQERLDARTRTMLTERFRVPLPAVQACRERLHHEALWRMRGAGNGVWTREDLEKVIADHGGYAGTSALAADFVPPTNWNELVGKLASQHAIIITGPSGTGKTQAANALVARLRDELPGLEVVPVNDGPKKIDAYDAVGPVVFAIEDPWGKFRLEPGSAPWNDAINGLLRTAGPDRKFVITSRADVLDASAPKSLHKKWTATLGDENYRRVERARLFENRLKKLPRRLQATVLKTRRGAVDRLLTPLEMDRWFDELANGMAPDESEHDYLERCMNAALLASVEHAVLESVRERGDWRWAALAWGLFKARARQSFNILPRIQSRLTKRDPTLEDGLEPYINFLVAGRNLRQAESSLSYQHPRVELGLEMALNEKPELSSRVLRYLAEALIELDTGADDWGREGAAHLVAACRTQKRLDLDLEAATQARLDNWVSARLAMRGPDFEDDLALAASVGSPDCAAAELARWLSLTQDEGENWFMLDWDPGPRDDAWYERIAAAPETRPVCEAFVLKLLAYKESHYPPEFADHIARLAPGLAPAFRLAVLAFVERGYHSVDSPILRGALADLPGFGPVVDAAAAHLDTCAQEEDDDTWLAVLNGDHGDDAEDYMLDLEAGESARLCLRAYVRALRDAQGWTAVRDHPRAAHLVHAWLREARGPQPIDEAEWDALARAAFGTPDEEYFWTLALDHWRPSYAPLLLRRLCEGTADAETRGVAARVLAAHPNPLLADMVEVLLARGDERRIFEVALDLNTWAEDTEKVAAKTVTQALVGALPDPLAEAVEALLDRPTGSDASPPFLARLRALDAGANDALRLAQAQALGTRGIDVADLLADVLGAPDADTHQAVAIAEDTVQLAARFGLWTHVEAALQHRFANVRRQALVTLAHRTTGPLPAALLAVAADHGPRVRKALLKILTARPHPLHVPTLLALARDTWSPYSPAYDDIVDYPIAAGAARCLRDLHRLEDGHVDDALAVARLSDDDDVGRNLLRAVLRRRVDTDTNKVLALALGGTAPLHAIAANALLDEVQCIDAVAAARIAARELVRQPLSVAPPLAGVIGTAAAPDHVIAGARALAASTSRRVLLVPLWQATLGRPALATDVAALLPEQLVEALAAALAGGRKLPADALDELGDVRDVEAVKRRLGEWFESPA